MTVIALTKSTLRSTVRLTLKTKLTLTSTLSLPLKLWQRRKRRANGGGRLAFLPVARKKIEQIPTAIAGSQEIRLAVTAGEIDSAQALRYRVFYDEMGAKPLSDMAVRRRDYDQFDPICEHLVVIDHKPEAEGEVVGTYRVMRREHARRAGGFYSSSEYDISNLEKFPGTLMELGRSCVDARYRDRATMQLLFRGIAEYVNLHKVDVMFGCASLPGTDPEKLKMQLSYLYHYHLAPEDVRTRARPDRYTPMNLLPKEAIDPKRALASLPPLLKGYLRVGGFVGDGAVIDHQFNTTDVCIIVKTAQISERYTRHYEIGTREETTPFRKAS